jgi:hypothetical protein
MNRITRLACLLLSTLACASCAEMSQIIEASGSQASGSQTSGSQSSASNPSALSRAIKESLEIGSTRAATMLSKAGGYSQSPIYRIELPQQVQPIASRLRQFGLGGQLDRVEALMNQGAEHAAVEAKGVFIDAVRAMTVSDALGIIRGSDTAASEYFRQQTEATLRQRYQPIIQRNLEQIGFYRQYQQFLSSYRQLPLTNKPDLDLEQHVLTQSLDALFKQVGEEERAIRKDPLGKGSSAIAAVFGR